MRILCLSAHPDDLEFPIGGIIIALARKHDVHIVTMTDGSAGTYGDAKIRKAEQEKAAECVGATLEWVGLADCSLLADQEAILSMAQRIRDIEPDVVVAPHWDQRGGPFEFRSHPDHRALGAIARDALRLARFNIARLDGAPYRCEHVLWYMVPHHLEANVQVDVTELQGSIEQLWQCHESQLQLMDGKLVEYLVDRRARGEKLIEELWVERDLPEGLFGGVTVKGP